MSHADQPKAPVKTHGKHRLPSDGKTEGSTGEAQDPASLLLQALGSKEPQEKRAFAELGLARLQEAISDEDDDELEALLLRQSYLAELEEGNDTLALSIACEMIEIGTLGDIARQDAARAALGVGDLSSAIGHLRIAARVCPASRRAFHYGHLGALLRFAGRPDEAVDAFTKASRWATDNRILFVAQMALAEADTGRTHADLKALRDELRASGHQGYALWILGELSLLMEEKEAGENYLRLFLSRQIEGGRAKSLSLKPEIAHANQLLRSISA